MYLHDVNVSADVWEALDTERGGLREKSSLDSRTRKRWQSFVALPLGEESGNCTCLANLLHYIMDVILTCEFFEKP